LEIGRCTENYFVDASKDDQLVAVLNQGLETPIEGLDAAFVGTGCAKEDSGILCALVTLGLDLEGEAEHACIGVLKGVEGDFGSIRRGLGRRMWVTHGGACGCKVKGFVGSGK
jgi:hypothetical protein